MFDTLLRQRQNHSTVTSERIQRQIDQHLDAAEAASLKLDWLAAADHAQAVVDLEPGNKDAPAMLAAANRALERARSKPQIPRTG